MQSVRNICFTVIQHFSCGSKFSNNSTMLLDFAIFHCILITNKKITTFFLFSRRCRMWEMENSVQIEHPTFSFCWIRERIMDKFQTSNSILNIFSNIFFSKTLCYRLLTHDWIYYLRNAIQYRVDEQKNITTPTNTTQTKPKPYGLVIHNCLQPIKPLTDNNKKS